MIYNHFNAEYCDIFNNGANVYEIILLRIIVVVVFNRSNELD
jgi:hypothetical protein